MHSATVPHAEETTKIRNPLTISHFGDSAISGTATAKGSHAIPLPEDHAMDLATWLPAMISLGVVAVGLMFLFVEACDKV